MITLLGAGPPTPGGAAPSALLTGLVAYYKLDGALTDAAGSRNLTGGGGETYGAGKIGQCLTIGTASRTPLGGLTAGQPFSVAGWLRPTSEFPDANSGFQFSGATAGVFSDGGGNFLLGSSGSAGSSPVVANTWRLFAVVWDGTNVTGYVNVTPGAPAPEAPPDVTADTFQLATGGSDVAWIDELGVWSRALSGSDVSLLYNAGAGTTYPF